MEASDASKKFLADFVCALYAGARNEILQRMALRDRMIFAFVVFVGAIFAIAFKSIGGKPAPEAMLLVPSLSLSFSAFTYHHSAALASYVRYVRLELDPWLNSNGTQIPIWENSASLKSNDRFFALLRSGGEVFLYCFTATLSIIISVFKFSEMSLPSIFLWISLTVNTIILIVIALMTLHSFRRRTSILSEE